MKKNISRLFALIAVLLLFRCQSSSQQKTDKPINENEVTWEADIYQALADAKKQNKLLFVECYSPTCQYCQALEPYFKKPEVAKKYNSNFVNFKLDVGNAELVKFLNERNIWLPSFPMFLFFDGDGKLVHQSGVDPTIESVNGVANLALDPKKRASGYAERFQKGERSVDFLSEYASYARVIRDTTANIQAANALFEAFDKSKIASEESWKLTKKTVSDMDNGFAEYWLNHVKEAAVFESKEGHSGNESNILGGIVQASIYGARSGDIDMAKVNKIKKYMTNLGVGQYIDGYTWELESKALIKEGKGTQALAVGQKMANASKGNGSALVYITRVYTDNFKDNSFIPTARKWLAEALPTINQDNVKAEYFYELARLDQKEGKIEDARKNASQALVLAQKTSTKSSKFGDLINALK
jgi:thioredoxin-related protein